MGYLKLAPEARKALWEISRRYTTPATANTSNRHSAVGNQEYKLQSHEASQLRSRS